MLKNLIDFFTKDWAFSPALPDVWAELNFPANCLIAIFNLASLYCMARILVVHRNEPRLYRLGIACWMASLGFGLAAPLLGFNYPLAVRSLAGSFGSAVVLYFLAFGVVKINIKNENLPSFQVKETG